MTIFAVFADAATIIQWFIVSASTLCVFISHHFQTTGIDITSNPAPWIVLVLYTVEGVFYSSGEEEKFTYFVSVYWQFSWGVGGFLLLNLPLLGCRFLLNLPLLWSVLGQASSWAKWKVRSSHNVIKESRTCSLIPDKRSKRSGLSFSLENKRFEQKLEVVQSETGSGYNYKGLSVHSLI